MLKLPLKHTANQTNYWPSGPISSFALAIAETDAGKNNCSLIIAETAQQAEEIADALALFTGNDRDIVVFPSYEILPYDFFSPAEDVISKRLKIMQGLVTQQPMCIITQLDSCLYRLPPKQFILDQTLSFKVGGHLDISLQRQQLTDAGYRNVDTVTQHGEFAVRGSVIDIFPMGCINPLRIDLFDEEIDSIRTFDAETQLTIEQITQTDILPGAEFSLDRQSIRAFQNNWLARFDGDPRECSIYESIAKGYNAQGIEAYLPLFHSSMSSIFDYLHDDSQLLLAPHLENAGESFWGEITQRHEQYSGNLARPILEPKHLFLSVGELFESIKKFPRTQWAHPNQQHSICIEPTPELAADIKQASPFDRFTNYVLAADKVLVTAETAGRREVLLELMQKHQLKPTSVDNWQAFLESPEQICILTSRITQGFSIQGEFAIVTETELLDQKIRQHGDQKQSKQRWADADQIIKNLTELREDAPVVHIEHGVGRYRGLVHLDTGGQDNEYLLLEYAEKNKLYVPVSSLHLISRYSGADGDSAPLHRLGSEQWDKAKRKAKQQIKDTAAELLDIYAKRMAKPGHGYVFNEEEYAQFCEEFPFEETNDQLSSMSSVLSDMLATRPMDRLICGDVGFGKTEVAMRAAFVAVNGKRQVLVLVPTTLLARQHYDSFRDRFANWPIRIESISRLKSAKQQSETMTAFSQGKVDILIGTHKLLHESINTETLGLLIVDEEHRFGVRQKDKLKALKAEVDILAMTATPIPRTLNMAMASIRDLSIIATPPAKRLAVKTFVRAFDKTLVKEALNREMMRGGQTYYLHNEVRSIDRCANDLQALLPEARIAVAHGQMRERELEQIISDFYHHRFDILVCTTIVETGIDIPNANTLIIERADKFGLAQLHQLRGRVGRSHHQAYAYLMTPEGKKLSGDAEKRLDAIQAADHLGSGFTLATHDMEIRGAGELLGDNQSGQIHAIGFDLYQQLLGRAVKSLQSGKDINAELDGIEKDIEINLKIPALIPDDYLPDVNNRLQLYKRLSNAENNQQTRALQVEMIDRFGLLPDSTKNLFRLHTLKLRAKAIGIEKIEAGEHQGKVFFASDAAEKQTFDPMKLIQLIQQSPAEYAFAGPTAIQFKADMDTAEKRLQRVERLLDLLK